MRSIAVLAVMLLAAGCSSEREPATYEAGEQSSPAAMDMAAPPMAPSMRTDAAAGPGISVTAAPGVAFNYAYAFRLPAVRIAEVQERHAQACEKLGVARCRITGMRYRLVDDQDIEAMLAFKLDPAIAREFGKQGIAVVVDAEGMLVESEISGVDAGAAIDAADRSEAQLLDQIAELERRLAARGLSNSERQSLTAQLDRLRDSLRAVRAERDDREESLATTPMVFAYGSGRLVPGFETRTFADALERSLDNLEAGLMFIMVAAITLLPWLLLLAAAIWLVRRFRHRLPSWRPEDSVRD